MVEFDPRGPMFYFAVSLFCIVALLVIAGLTAGVVWLWGVAL